MSIAWRLAQNPSELKKRPLLSDISTEGDKVQRFDRLKVRLETQHSERATRYNEASVVLRDSVSAPEICAQKLIHLVERYLSGKKEQTTEHED
jgi:hypothetical protein